MAASKPVKGKYCMVVDTESTPNELPGVNFTLTIDGKLADYSNFKDGRVRESTLNDATLNLTVVYDEDDPPDNTAIGKWNLRPGVFKVIRCYVNNAQTKFFEIPVKISTVTPKVDSQESLLGYDVVAMLHGEITWPVHGS